MGAEHWDARVGSVADEAVRLLESLRRPAAAEPEQPEQHEEHGQHGQHEPHEHTGPSGAEHDPVCQWCPICRGAAVVRSLSPQTLARLADLASLASGVLADLAGARAEARADGEPGAPGAAGRPRASTPQPPASRPIPVQDADDPQETPRG